jgi:oxygen-independent coproporphyrinogen III oxidase
VTTVSDARLRLEHAITTAQLPNYVYSYPSKRAYRAVVPPMTIAEAWSGHRGPLNLYLHIPFCGYRCAFCTLFLTTNHGDDLIDRYVGSLCRQIAMYGDLLADAEVVSIYIGGGTPTTLDESQFKALFGTLRTAFHRIAPAAEIGVEGSPDTIRPRLLSALRALGVNRISMGIQTLDRDEAQRAGRRYPLERVAEAAAAISGVGFDNVNYDLIFGLEGQTRQSWLTSLDATLALGPDTITIYPIVFRPLTVIDRHHGRSDDGFMTNEQKYALYDETVRLLTEQGFRQNTFVRFSRRDMDGLQQEVADFAGVPLLGLGAGARSYSPRLHYSTDFAVRRTSTNEIIQRFADHTHSPAETPRTGFIITSDESRRRYCILNLSLGRLDRSRYECRFGDSIDEWRDEIDALVDTGCVQIADDGSIELTSRGFMYSNVIATLFQSTAVTELEERYVPS